MKTTLLLALSFLTITTIAQTPCSGGMAGSYPCNGYDLQASFSLGQLNANSGADSWGWVDPTTGTEYALIALDNGTAFFELSDPTNPTYLGKLPTQTTSISWRDIKVYNDHAFIVSEAGGHGMQVFDLTRLRNVTNPPVTFTSDEVFTGFGSAHNIVINEDTGYAYIVGSNQASGGPLFINIQDPLNPTMEGSYSTLGYSHDAQVVTYNGPDTDYTGREIYIGSHGDFGNGDVVAILDVTNKSSVSVISTFQYSNAGYTHQGWFTADQRYFLTGDEFDETDFGTNTRTVILDLTDLDNPSEFFNYVHPSTASIDHNGYVRGNTFYLSSYSAGMRAIDISDIANQNMTEIGFFDSYPANNNANFNGAWNAYPFLPSGNIIISDIDGGFFLVRDPNFLNVDEFTESDFSMIPNPSEDIVTITSTKTPINKIEIRNLLGQRIINVDVIDNTSQRINVSDLASGMYLVTINNTNTKRLLVK